MSKANPDTLRRHCHGNKKQNGVCGELVSCNRRQAFKRLATKAISEGSTKLIQYCTETKQCGLSLGLDLDHALERLASFKGHLSCDVVESRSRSRWPRSTHALTDGRDLEAVLHLTQDELRSSLVAAILKLLIHSEMMLLRINTAAGEQADQRLKLRPRVTRVVSMLRRL